MGTTAKKTTAADKKINEFLTRAEINEAARPGEEFEDAQSRLMAERKKQSVAAGERQEWLDNVDRMPVWKNGFSALPNGLVRSAVFTSANHQSSGERQYRRSETLTVIGPGEVHYTGDELRQDDKSLLLVLTDLMRKEHGNKPLQKGAAFTIDTNAHRLLKAMGWTVNPRSYERLRSGFTRLNATEMLVLSNADAAIGQQKGRGFSIIQDYDFDTPRTLTVRMPHAYFEVLRQGFTLVNMDVYHSLPVGISRWLYTYVVSHKKQQKISVTALIKHAGLKAPTTSKDLAKRRQLIREAVRRLIMAGVLRNGGIDATDRFYYERTANAKKAPATIAREKAEAERAEAEEAEREYREGVRVAEQIEAEAERAKQEALDEAEEAEIEARETTVLTVPGEFSMLTDEQIAAANQHPINLIE